MFVIFPEISAFSTFETFFLYSAFLADKLKEKSQNKIFQTKKNISEECSVIEIIPFGLLREEEKLPSVSW